MGVISGPILPPDQLTSPAELSSAGGLVSSRFNTASVYAAELWALAQSLLSQLADTDYTIDWDGVDLPVVSAGGLDGITPEDPPAPVINDITVAAAEFSAEAPTGVEADIPVRTSPSANLIEPSINIPAPPDVTWPVYDLTAPSVSDADVITAPNLTLPAVPQLQEISIPSPPEYNIPEFDWELPTDDLTPPEPQFVWNEAEYDSAIKQALADKLYSNLLSGGTGLPVATEQAIYSRAVSRQLDEEQDALDKVLNFFSSRLYELPPGALSHQMLEMNNKVLKTREDLNNDILIQQSKLAQENTHFIIDRSIQNEKNLMEYTNAFQTRALDAAKFVVQGALVIYTAKVEAYKARLLAYSTLAEIYKARIQGEIVKAEFYKAQMEGIVASAEVQKALVQVYLGQVEGVKALIDIYKAEIEAAHLKAKVDEIRIQGFAAMVQAYSAQVVAAAERYRGYQAQIAGEIAKADLYKSQAQAYAARVDAYKTEVEADTLVVRQQIEINRNEIEVYKALLQKYTTEVQAAVSQAEIQAKNEGLKVDVFKALTMEYAAELDALAKVYVGNIEKAKAYADTELKEAELIIREMMGKFDLQQKGMSVAGQIAAQMAAAAISGVSASANIQHGESRSDSTSMSKSIAYQYQESNAYSFAVQHIYNHEE